jgi:hypothetical protein
MSRLVAHTLCRTAEVLLALAVVQVATGLGRMLF